MEYLHEKYTDEELLSIQAELIDIRDSYRPSMPWDAPTANTFYITATWNTRHQESLLDGPEVEYILGWDPNVEEPQPVEETPAEEEVTPIEEV